VAPRDFALAQCRGKGGFVSRRAFISLTAYYELLSRWNQINLTALENLANVDWLLLNQLPPRVTSPLDRRLMDVIWRRSPAIPLKSRCRAGPNGWSDPKVRVSKRVRHLSRIGHVEMNRCEELAKPELHEAYGLVSTRAVRIEARSSRSGVSGTRWPVPALSAAARKYRPRLCRPWNGRLRFRLSRPSEPSHDFDKASAAIVCSGGTLTVLACGISSLPRFHETKWHIN
jgi:hypothetical protein